MKMHSTGLTKRQLFKQVAACARGGGAGTEAHLAALRAFHESAWSCFDARKCGPPDTAVQYEYSCSFTDGHRTAQPPRKRNKRSPVDPRTRKAILAVERDSEYIWQELHRAIDAFDDGTRSKVRAIEALGKWRKKYDARWDCWLARGRKKVPTGQKSIQEFADTNGQVHIVAGHDKYFASAKEAKRFQQAEEIPLVRKDEQTNQFIRDLFERAVDDPELIPVLEKALNVIEDFEREERNGSDAD